MKKRGRKLSLKAKLTLLYTLLMTAVVAVALAVLLSLSNQEMLSGVQGKLRERVAQAPDEVEFRNGDLRFDSDLLELKDNVYLSLYQADGTLLYGKIPLGLIRHLCFRTETCGGLTKGKRIFTSWI